MRTRMEWAPLPLRLLLGAAFIYHGLPKLGTGREQFVGMLQGLGIPMPEIMAWVVGFVEVVGGIFLILGAFTTVASALLLVTMLVAMFTVHLPNGFNTLNIQGMGDNGPVLGMPGVEYSLLFIAGLLTLMIGGPGALSVDRVLVERGVIRRLGERPEFPEPALR